MEILFLDYDLSKNVRAYVDRDIPKYITQYAHIISNVYHQTFETNIDCIYRKSNSYTNGVAWCRSSIDNFQYLATLGAALISESKRRKLSNRTTRARKIFQYGIDNPPTIPDIGMTPFPQYVDNKYTTTSNDAIDCIRLYYADIHEPHEWSMETPTWYRQPSSKKVKPIKKIRKEMTFDQIMWALIDRLEWERHMDVEIIRTRLSEFSVGEFRALQKFVSQREIDLMELYILKNLKSKTPGNLYQISAKMAHVIGCGKEKFEQARRDISIVEKIDIDVDKQIFTLYIYLDDYEELFELKNEHDN